MKKCKEAFPGAEMSKSRRSYRLCADWTVPQVQVKPSPPAALTLSNLWREKGVNDDLLKRMKMHLRSSSIYYKGLHVRVF